MVLYPFAMADYEMALACGVNSCLFLILFIYLSFHLSFNHVKSTATFLLHILI